MKKQSILSALIVASAGLGLVSCGGDNNTGTAIGAYHYNSYGNEYGMAVKVSYNSDTLEITDVVRDAETITANNYVETTASSAGTWDGTAQGAAYRAAIDAQLKEYVGQNATTLYNAIKAGVVVTYTDAEHSGVNFAVTDSMKNDSKFVIIAGATQTAARTAIAIANAIAAISDSDSLTEIVTAEPAA